MINPVKCGLHVNEREKNQVLQPESRSEIFTDHSKNLQRSKLAVTCYFEQETLADVRRWYRQQEKVNRICRKKLTSLFISPRI
ncbi:uncharacterized protein LOC143215108 isoform X2 [Lasioglossum baleicum]